MVATLQGAAALLFAAATPSPAAAQVAKVQKLTDSYRADTRLVAVAMTGSHERRCVGATVGHFAILTSHDCLAEWWNDTKSHSVGFTADQQRRFASSGIERAWRNGGGAKPWAVLQTAGHSSAYYGYEDLERTAPTEVFDFIGFSKKVKDGKELALQPRCRLDRVSPGVYTSECGEHFGTGAILLLRKTERHHYVSGLGHVRSFAKVGKRRVFTIETTSLGDYGSQLAAQRREQDARYASAMARQAALLAQQRAAAASDGVALENARARSARRRENVEKFANALGQLAMAWGRTRGTTPSTPPVYAPPPTPWSSAATPASTSALNCVVRLNGPSLYSGTMAVAPTGGGDVVVNISTAPGCPWRFDLVHQNGGAWIFTSSRLEGTGPGSIRFSASALPVEQSMRGLLFRVVGAPGPGQPAGDRDFRFRITQCTADIPFGSCGAGASTSQ
jgi:hypothetical protein